jgi:hypothetical protein
MALSNREEMIAGLLRKAETASPEEAEALTAAAERFMLKYGIEAAQLAAARLGQDKTAEEIVEKTMLVTGIYDKALRDGFNLVVNAFGEMKMLSHSYKNETTIYIIGYAGDVRQVMTLLSSLEIQSIVALRYWWKNLDYRPTGMSGYKARRSYVLGFFQGAARRIAENKLQVISEVDAESGGSSALVLVDRRNAVETWTGEKYPKLRKTRGYDVTTGYYDGVRDGRNANTGDKAIAQTVGIEA